MRFWHVCGFSSTVRFRDLCSSSYNSSVTALRHFYGLNHLHFITASTYRRARLFDSDRFRQHFAMTLGTLRSRLHFQLLGYVLMPEHFHLLIWPSETANPSQIIKSLKERTAKYILKNLADNNQFAWCRAMLSKLRLPPTVHDESLYRVWQRRFYDMNVWTERKRLQKLHYMHENPVKLGLVDSPDQWVWSSFRYYHLQDSSLLATDRLP